MSAKSSSAVAANKPATGVKTIKRFFLTHTTRVYTMATETMRSLGELIRPFRTTYKENSEKWEEQVELVSSNLVGRLVKEYDDMVASMNSVYEECEKLHFVVDKSTQKILRRARKPLRERILAIYQNQDSQSAPQQSLALCVSYTDMKQSLDEFQRQCALFKKRITAFIDSVQFTKIIGKENLAEKFHVGQANEGDEGEELDEEAGDDDLAFVSTQLDADGKEVVEYNTGEEAKLESDELGKREAIAMLDFVTACNSLGVKDACKANGLSEKELAACSTAEDARALIESRVSMEFDLDRMHPGPAFELFSDNVLAIIDLDFADTCNALGPDIACSLFDIERSALLNFSDIDQVISTIGVNGLPDLRVLSVAHARELFGQSAHEIYELSAENFEKRLKAFNEAQTSLTASTGRISLRKRDTRQRHRAAAIVDHDRSFDGEDDAVNINELSEDDEFDYVGGDAEESEELSSSDDSDSSSSEESSEEERRRERRRAKKAKKRKAAEQAAAETPDASPVIVRKKLVKKERKQPTPPLDAVKDETTKPSLPTEEKKEEERAPVAPIAADSPDFDIFDLFD